jgi:hypothetical protein
MGADDGDNGHILYEGRRELQSLVPLSQSQDGGR